MDSCKGREKWEGHLTAGGSNHRNGNAMLSREGVPLHDEIPVFAELAAIRVSNESLGSSNEAPNMSTIVQMYDMFEWEC